MSLVPLLVLTMPTAHAWSHLGFAWTLENQPVAYQVAIDETDGALDSETQLTAIETAFQTWQDATPCAQLAAVQTGPDDDVPPTTVSMYDATDQVPEGSPTLVSFRTSDRAGAQWDAALRSETIYSSIIQAEIVLSSEVDWISRDDALAGKCTTEWVLETELVQAVGHLWGLDNSCILEDGADCTDDEVAAAMYWEKTPCDTDGAVLEADDIAAAHALYNVLGVPVRTPDAPTAVGETVCILADAVLDHPDTITWDLGDGNSATGREVCHAWTEPGVYTVAASPDDADCGDSNFTTIYACDAPAIPAGEEAMLTLSEGGSGQLSIGVQLSVVDEACIESVRVVVADSMGDVVVDADWSQGDADLMAPQFDVALEADIYTIELTVLGYGGDVTETTTYDATTTSADDDATGSKDGCGCNQTSGSPKTLALFGLMGLLLVRRRGSAPFTSPEI